MWRKFGALIRIIEAAYPGRFGCVPVAAGNKVARRYLRRLAFIGLGIDCGSADQVVIVHPNSLVERSLTLVPQDFHDAFISADEI